MDIKKELTEYVVDKIKEIDSKNISFNKELISILSKYIGQDWKNGNDNEPLDGDEVETLAAHILNKLQHINGNITDHEYKVREELGDKRHYITPEVFIDGFINDRNTLVKFESELEEGDVQFGILHDDFLICLCGCGGIFEYGDYTIIEKIEKTNVSELLFNHFNQTV